MILAVILAGCSAVYSAGCSEVYSARGSVSSGARSVEELTEISGSFSESLILYRREILFRFIQ